MQLHPSIFRIFIKLSAEKKNFENRTMFDQVRGKYLIHFYPSKLIGSLILNLHTMTYHKIVNGRGTNLVFAKICTRQFGTLMPSLVGNGQSCPLCDFSPKMPSFKRVWWLGLCNSHPPNPRDLSELIKITLC